MTYEQNVYRIIRKHYPQILKLPYNQMWDQFMVLNQRDFAEYGKKQSVINPVDDNYRKEGCFEPLAEGSVIHIKDEPYPIRGISRREDVLAITQCKRSIRTFQEFIKNQTDFKLNLFQRGLVLIAATQYWKFFLEWLWYAMQDAYMDRNYYTQPVRELHRVLSDRGVITEKIRDISCVILQGDNAYKSRFQDIASEINKELLLKNPRKEIKRLLDLLFSREPRKENGDDPTGSYKMKPMADFFVFYLRFNPHLVTEIANTLFAIDPNEVRMSKADVYWEYATQGYNFRDIDFEYRREIVNQMKHESSGTQAN